MFSSSVANMATEFLNVQMATQDSHISSVSLMNTREQASIDKEAARKETYI